MKRLTPTKVRMIFGCLLVVGAIIGFIGAFAEIKVLTVSGVLVMIGDCIFYFLCYRCPYCREYLDRNTGNFCPHCGKQIR